MIVSPLGTARFPVPLEWGVPPGVEAVPAARRMVMAIVRDWGVPLPPDALQDVELCASEVIANALVHTAERCVVTVRRRAGRLRVEVADGSVVLPRQERDAGSCGGRGLLLVEALAHAWGGSRWARARWSGSSSWRVVNRRAPPADGARRTAFARCPRRRSGGPRQVDRRTRCGGSYSPPL
ncbi:ATP-binding protein [Kitasatospora sp. NPDC059973]|uniref:ATP-binding protein n=1 Tax=Kitasatospora sp. NPDC059973 TaxID=3347020 RepID=UPI00367689B5